MLGSVRKFLKIFDELRGVNKKICTMKRQANFVSQLVIRTVVSRHFVRSPAHTYGDETVYRNKI